MSEAATCAPLIARGIASAPVPQPASHTLQPCTPPSASSQPRTFSTVCACPSRMSFWTCRRALCESQLQYAGGQLQVAFLAKPCTCYTIFWRSAHRVNIISRPVDSLPPLKSNCIEVAFHGFLLIAASFAGLTHPPDRVEGAPSEYN